MPGRWHHNPARWHRQSGLSCAPVHSGLAADVVDEDVQLAHLSCHGIPRRLIVHTQSQEQPADAACRTGDKRGLAFQSAHAAAIASKVSQFKTGAGAMQTIGVIGAGLMGNGIAHVAAQAGYSVILSDVAMERCEAARATIAKNMARQVGKGVLSQEQADAALARISLTTQAADFAAADLVIEAATENEAVKVQIFQGLATLLKPDALLASNTSSISITRLAAATGRADRFCGLHFFNPVPLMALVEIIPGLATSAETTAAMQAFAARLGKTAILAGDAPAFIVNRVLCPMLNEAIFALGDGVGSVVDIDTGLKLGANHPMGPLTLADFVGLDTLISIMKVMQDSTGDPKYRPAPLLVKMVEAGWLGRKSGRGFYDYTGAEPVPTR
jgi:3-hydroxybutyryl-CoA dehydrogenase